MAYAAKCDTAAHTRFWVTGTGSVINRLSEMIDDNASGVEENDNPGNFQPWSEFMTEVVEDAIYQIHEDFDVGDGSTATTLTSEEEYVRFDTGTQFRVRISAIFNMGAASGSYSERGSYWSLSPSATSRIGDGGTFGLYASKLENRAAQKCYWNTGTLVIQDSMLSGGYDHSIDHFQNSFYIQSGMSSAMIDNIYIHNLYQFQLHISPTVTRYHFHKGEYGISPQQTLTISNANASSVVKQALLNTADTTVTIKDPVMVLARASIQHNQATSVTKEQFTININVSDRSGAALQSVTVLCEDQADAEAFSVSTDASGDIAEQAIITRSWSGTLETETDNNDFKFTLSKAGYETLVLEAIRVSAPIIWHLELQSQKAPPRAWRH